MATTKRSRGLLAILILMIIALLSFSIFPIVSSIVAPKSSTNNHNIQSTSPGLENTAQAYELVLTREPANQNALEKLLEIRLQQGKIAQAIAILEKFVAVQPKVEYSLLLADLQQQTGESEAAIATYQTILQQNPRQILALNGLKTILLAQGQTDQAIELLQQTIAAQDPEIDEVRGSSAVKRQSLSDTATVELILGDLYKQQEQYDQAIAIYDRLIASYPDDFRPLLAKALCLQAQGDKETAQELFTQAQAVAPSEFDAQIRALAQANAA